MNPDKDDVVVIAEGDDYQPTESESDDGAMRPSPGPEVVLSDVTPEELDRHNPWKKGEAAAFLRRGMRPADSIQESGDVLILSRRNGVLLWVLLLECLVFVALCFGLVYAIMNQRVTAIPAVGAIAGYRKAESDKQAVIAFADMVSNEMETWSWWNAMDNVDRVKPFLDPEIRGPYESAFSVNLRDSKRYAQRSVYERVKVEYKGVVRESVHKIIVFYQVWVGRGKTDRDFTIDRISRRAKILEIAEGEPTTENPFGLFVIRHINLTDNDWMGALLKRAEVGDEVINPWDEATGLRSPKVRKEAP